MKWFQIIFFVWSYSVARVVAYWLPCCWLEVEVEPAVAMVAGVQKGEEAAGCWGEEVEVASCPLEEAADLQGNQQSDRFFHGYVLMPAWGMHVYHL